MPQQDDTLLSSSSSSSDDFSLSQLQQYYHLPIAEAAKELQTCETILKKLCRNKGITRWPHRKIRSIDNIIHQLEISRSSTSRQSDIERFSNQIIDYQIKRQMVIDDPNVDFSKLVPKPVLQSISKIKLKHAKLALFYPSSQSPPSPALLSTHHSADNSDSLMRSTKSEDNEGAECVNNNNIQINGECQTDAVSSTPNCTYTDNGNNICSIDSDHDHHQHSHLSRNQSSSSSNHLIFQTFSISQFTSFDHQQRNIKRKWSEVDQYMMSHIDHAVHGGGNYCYESDFSNEKSETTQKRQSKLDLTSVEQFQVYRNSLPALKYRRFLQSDSALPLYFIQL